MLIPSVSLAEKQIHSGPLDSMKCYWQMLHWDNFQRQNWSNGVTWLFDTKFWNDNQSSKIIAKSVADPNRYITMTCDKNTFTVEQGWK
jgi:hypothetical protein